jgi:hypothetical protein
VLKLEQIQKNAAISGLEPGQVVRIVTTEQVGDNAITVYYKTADGQLRERMLFRTDEAKLSLAEAGRPWAFDAPGEAFKLAAEAYRINLAHLFDPMMAVHTLERGTAAAPDHGGLRVDAAAPAAALRYWPMTLAPARPSWPACSSASC